LYSFFISFTKIKKGLKNSALFLFFNFIFRI
jgi:hypothetical protein